MFEAPEPEYYSFDSLEQVVQTLGGSVGRCRVVPVRDLGGATSNKCARDDSPPVSKSQPFMRCKAIGISRSGVPSRPM